MEVTITYFGADQLIPLAPRRKALRESFGFDCACARCVGEAATWEAVGGTVEAVAEVGRARGSGLGTLGSAAAACRLEEARRRIDAAQMPAGGLPLFTQA